MFFLAKRKFSSSGTNQIFEKKGKEKMKNKGIKFQVKVKAFLMDLHPITQVHGNNSLPSEKHHAQNSDRWNQPQDH